MTHRRSFHIPLSIVCAVAAAACEDSTGPRKITQTQTASMSPGDVKVGASSSERFGGGGFGAPHGADGSMGAASGGTNSDRELGYDVPSGWTELPPAQFREINLKPAGNPDAECYVTSLAMSGGVLENVNRWRKQFGQGPIDATALAALPTQKLLSVDAILVELEGDYTSAMQPGATAPTKKSSFAMVGLVATLGDQAVTVKMVGPKDLLRAERPKFDDFVRSLRGVPSNGLADGGVAHNRNAGDPHGTGMPASSPHTVPPVGGFDAVGITYTAPTGWTKEPDRPTRIATLRPPNATQSECSITAFPGDGGGAMPNLNRWRGQMGLPALSLEELAHLPKAKMFGVDGIVVDWRGTFTDTMNNRKVEKARFLGAIAITDSRAIFVKLSGPETEIDDKVRDGFMDLCGSLKE